MPRDLWWVGCALLGAVEGGWLCQLGNWLACALMLYLSGLHRCDVVASGFDG